MMLFVAAAIAATSALVGGLLPLHDVDAGPSSLEWLDFLLPWLLMLFAPIAVGAGLRRAFACK